MRGKEPVVDEAQVAQLQCADVREILRACYYAIDKKPISEAKLSFAEKEMLKLVVKKVKGTDIEILLKESGLIQ